MSLKQDFNFSLYLEKNFVKYFYSVQNLTITSWVFVLIVVFIWNVFISNTSDKTRLILMCTLPLTNIILLLAKSGMVIVSELHYKEITFTFIFCFKIS